MTAPISRTLKKTRPATRTALPEGVGRPHRGEGQKEGDDHSHAARSLPGEGDARLAQEVGDGVGGGPRLSRPRRRRGPGGCR